MWMAAATACGSSAETAGQSASGECESQCEEHHNSAVNGRNRSGIQIRESCRKSRAITSGIDSFNRDVDRSWGVRGQNDCNFGIGNARDDAWLAAEQCLRLNRTGQNAPCERGIEA